jgi:reactive chlorine resistance protein C
MNAATIRLLRIVGVRLLRYGLVLLLLMWGAAKFTQFEAELIKPLVENSPFVSWLYPVFGLRGASAIFGIFEVSAALVIATRKWLPRASGYASLATIPMFLVTLSFLVTTPGVFEPSSPWGGFLMKDIMLLGAAAFTAAEALEDQKT